MRIRGSFLPGIVMVALLAACSPLLGTPVGPQAMPSPAGDWKVSLTQSGGFAGVHLSVEVTSSGLLKAKDERSGRTVTKSLSTEQTSKLLGLYSASLAGAAQPSKSSCADCFLYDLQMTSADRQLHVLADDTTLSDSGAADLIRFLQQLRDDALRSAP